MPLKAAIEGVYDAFSEVEKPAGVDAADLAKRLHIADKFNGCRSGNE